MPTAEHEYVKIYNRRNSTEILNNQQLDYTILNNIDLDLELYLHGALFISGNIKVDDNIVGEFFKDETEETITFVNETSKTPIQHNSIVSVEITDWNYPIGAGKQSDPPQDLFPMATYLSSHNTAAEYYDYGLPKLRADSPIQASASTTLPQQEDTKITVLIHENQHNGELSLIIVCDSSPNSGGGTIRIEVTNLPSSSYIALSDDAHEVTKPNSTTVIGQFGWSLANTDGMCISGINGFTQINIAASNYSTRLTDWKLCSGISDVVTLEVVYIPLSNNIKIVNNG